MDGSTLRARTIDIAGNRFQILLQETGAAELGVHPGDRVRVEGEGGSLVAVVETTDSLVAADEVGVPAPLLERLGVDVGGPLVVRTSERPRSVATIQRKMAGATLEPEELRALVEDVVAGTLTDVELAAWVSSLEVRGMTLDEVEALTRAMVATGETLDFGEDMVFDKHSIGGVPGNKISLLVVPIVAAAGLLIPKTSSRAITGAAGTADIMEVFCDVHLDGERIRRVTREVGGCLSWGGAVNLAPADDLIIRVEHPLGLDPRAQLLASVLSKKKSVGANEVVIDLPTGPGTKIPDEENARGLATSFLDLGTRLGIRVECAVTYGGQPVGRAVGPALEANEALRALQMDPETPQSLVEKSTAVAGILLEMGGAARRGQGDEVARGILESGRALEKFREIVAAQDGTEPEEATVGAYSATLDAPAAGYCTAIHNRGITQVARTAGAPVAKGAGVMVHEKRGDKVEAGAPVLTIYAEKRTRLDEALAAAKRLQPVEVEGMLLERIPSYRLV